MVGAEIVYRDEKVEALRTAEHLVVRFLKPHTLRIPLEDRKAVDDEVIRMIKMRTVEGRKYFVQAEIGRLIGVSRQMVNRRWQVYRDEGLLALLAGEWDKSKITPALLDRLAELVVENPFLFAHEIKEKLKAEGVCEEISEASLYSALRQMDGRRMVMLMREKADRQSPQAFTEAGYVIERLFTVIEELLGKLRVQPAEAISNVGLYEQLRLLYHRCIRHRASPTEKDCYRPRKKLVRDCRRNIAFLQALLGRIFPAHRCPDCHSGKVRFFFRRPRGYVNARGEKIRSYSTIYRCMNRRCPTKYFTVPPKESSSTRGYTGR